MIRNVENRLLMLYHSWIIVCLLSLFIPKELKTEILTGPYFQAVDSQGITIMWESTLSEAGAVEYGLSNSLGAKKSTEIEKTAGNTFIHKARIDALAPGIKYYFKVIDDDLNHKTGTFQTAPNSGTSSFRIGIWGDSHFLDPARKMFEHMVNETKIDLGANHGDISTQDGGIYSDLQKAFVPLSLEIIGKSVPFFSAFGNHDVIEEGESESEIRKFVDHPITYSSSPSDRKGSYLTVYDNVVLIFIDWNRMATDLVPGAWLEEQLKSDLVQKARFTFMFIHRAPYYERWKVAEHPVVKNNVPYLSEKYGVNAVYSGHMHGYERGYKNGTYYITNGCGSYLDDSEPVDTNYAHITQGAWENTPVGFNYGLVNGYTTIEVKDSLAISRFHGFDRGGNFIGILDSAVMVDELWEGKDVSLTSEHKKLQKALHYFVNSKELSLFVGSAGLYTITINSVGGRVLYKKDLSLNSGQAHIPVNLSPGVHLISIGGSDIEVMYKCIIK